ncbi:class I SAM-dependent methyltransferase [Halobacterium rubrum]|uniref:class I SAM-dependent methyltransferase n=1 Tax=Halobacterium TaxID=2239 RepID=UPI0023513EB1|nr:class I SAM-dependent methyltransferase [Halobacterium sp. TGN-42-S1]
MPAADPADLTPALALADRPVERVLDLGGGTGRVARALGGDAVVADASRGMLEEAHEDGLETLQTDVRQLAVADESVDVVVVVDALHHFPARSTAVAEAARALRPGGVLVVRDFAPGTIRGRLLAAGEHLFGMGSRFDTADECAQRLDEAGLDARVLDEGFAFTVAGVKPGAP